MGRRKKVVGDQPPILQLEEKFYLFQLPNQPDTLRWIRGTNPKDHVGTYLKWMHLPVGEVEVRELIPSEPKLIKGRAE